MLDFSQRRELSLHAEIVADVNAVAVEFAAPTILIGAFARDLHLHFGAGLPIQRETLDVDLGVAVENWDTFQNLRSRLIEAKAFEPVEGKLHRLRKGSFAVDLIPFGELETQDRRIAWPPNGEIVMAVFGFREALTTAEDVLLPLGVRTRVVSAASLALLKLVAWQERHYEAPKKDAMDLNFLLRNFLALGNNQARLLDQFDSWANEASFDLEEAGARMLGDDIRQLLDAKGIERIVQLLKSQSDEATTGELVREMNSLTPDRALNLLRKLLQGLEHPD